jgi:hypothetical protein
MPLALTDDQIRAVMAAAAPLDPDKRLVLLQRLAGTLHSVRHPTDRDVKHGLQVALRGLQQQGHGSAA